MPDGLQHIIHTIRFEIITDDRGAALQMQDMISELMQVDLVAALEKVLSKHAIEGHHFMFDKIEVDLKQINHSQFKYEVIHFLPVELSRTLDSLITKFNYSQLAPVELTKTDEATHLVNTLALYLETGIWSLSAQKERTDPKDILQNMMRQHPDPLKKLIERIRQSSGKTVPRLAALLSLDNLKTLFKSLASTNQQKIFQSISEQVFKTISDAERHVIISKFHWEELAKKMIVRQFVEIGAKSPDHVKIAKEVTLQLSNDLKLPSYIFQVDKTGKVQLSPLIVKASEKKKSKVSMEQIVQELSSLISEQDAKEIKIPWPPEGFKPVSSKEMDRAKAKATDFKTEKEALEEIQRQIEHREAIAEKLKSVAEKAAAEDTTTIQSEDPSTVEETIATTTISKTQPDISAVLYRYLTGDLAWWEPKSDKIAATSVSDARTDFSLLAPAQIIGLFQWLRKSNQLINRQVEADEALKTIKAIRSDVLVARLMSAMSHQVSEKLIGELYPGQQRLVHFLEISLQYLSAPLKNMFIEHKSSQPLKQILLQKYIEGKKRITNLKDARSEVYAAVQAILPQPLLIPFLQSLGKFGPGRDMESMGVVSSRPDVKLLELPFLRRFAEEWPLSFETPKEPADNTTILESVPSVAADSTKPSPKVNADTKPETKPVIQQKSKDVRIKEQFMVSMLSQMTQFVKQMEPKIVADKKSKELLQTLIKKLSEPIKAKIIDLQVEEVKTLFSMFALLMPEKLFKTGLDVLYPEHKPLDVDKLTVALNDVFTLNTPTENVNVSPKRVTGKEEQPAKADITVKEPDPSIEDEPGEKSKQTSGDEKPEESGQNQIDSTIESDRSEKAPPDSEASETAATLSSPEKPTVPETEKTAIQKKQPPADESAPLHKEINEQDDAWTEMIDRMRSGVWALKLLEQSIDMPMKTLNDLTEDMEKALFVVYIEEGRIPPELLLEGVPVEKHEIVAWLNTILEKQPVWLQKSLVRAIANPAAIGRLAETLSESGINLMFQLLGSKNKALLSWIQDMFLQSKNWLSGEKERTLMLKALATLALKPNLDPENVYLYFLRLHLKFAEKEFGISAKDWMDFWENATPHVSLQPEKFETAQKLVIQQIEDRKSRPDFNKYFVMDNEKPQRSFLTEKVMVNNAGAVLLNPFLLHLFKVTELLDDKRQFKSPGHVWQAIQMLHYAVTRQKTTLEFEILLYKLMCGMDPDWLPPEEGTLNEKHIPLIDSMLKAVISQWTALGKSTVDNLRGSFLIRNGLIADEDTRWEITVEQKPWDILVEKIPWTIGFIKLPWMKKRIQVIWR